MPEHVVEHKFGGIDRQFSRLDLRQIEDVIDDGQEMPSGGLNAPDVMCHARRGVYVGNQMAHANDRVERGSDFVAHVGQKFRLGPPGGLGLIAGGRQLFGPYGHLVFQCPGQVFEFALRPDLLGDVEPDRPHGHHGLVVTEYREADDAVGRFTAVGRLF